MARRSNSKSTGTSETKDHRARSTAESESRATPAGSRWSRLRSAAKANAPTVLVALIAFAVYLPTLRGDWLGWDDDRNLTDNPQFRGLGLTQLAWMFGHFHMGHYQPLSWLTLGLDYTIWGMNPVGYHLTNVVLHAMGTLLFGLLAADVARRVLDATGGQTLTPTLSLVGRGSRAAAPQSGIGPSPSTDIPDPRSEIHDCLGIPSSVWIGAVAAALWSLHPLRVEAVAWITQRREVLCGVLTLLTLRHHWRGGRLWVTVLLAALAMLAKATAMVLPALLLMIDLCRPRPESVRPRAERVIVDAIRLTPVWLLAIACAVTAVFAQKAAGAYITTDVLPYSRRFVIFGYGLGFYVEKTLWPSGLATLHAPRVGNTWEPLPFVYGRAALVGGAAVLVLAAAWWGRRRWPAGIVLLLALLGMLLPVSGLGQSGPQFAAERYTYQSGWALTLLVVLGIARLLSYFPTATRRVVAAAACVALVGSLSWAAVVRQAHWRDTEALWRRQLAVYPGDPYAQFNLGMYYKRLDPPRDDLALQWLGTACEQRPEFHEAQCALAEVLDRQGRKTEAVPHLLAALKSVPSHVQYRGSLARLYWELNRRDEALAEFERVIQYAPGDPKPYRQWAFACANFGDGTSAIAAFERGLAAFPNDPDLNSEFAWTLATHPSAAVRNGQRAVAWAAKAAALKGPQTPAMVVLRAAALAESGDFDAAQVCLRSGIQANPGARPALEKMLNQMQRHEPVRTPPKMPF